MKNLFEHLKDTYTNEPHSEYGSTLTLLSIRMRIMRQKIFMHILRSIETEKNGQNLEIKGVSNMRMVDIIANKRDGKELTKEEIEFFINGYTKGEIPDYQASALLMAIFFNDMTAQESANLTMAMVNSGDQIDLSALRALKLINIPQAELVTRRL